MDGSPVSPATNIIFAIQRVSTSETPKPSMFTKGGMSKDFQEMPKKNPSPPTAMRKTCSLLVIDIRGVPGRTIKHNWQNE